ncbi:MAG: hypothetical protein RH948_01690 [Cyclobacteriaceae bacterium]
MLRTLARAAVLRFKKMFGIPHPLPSCIAAGRQPCSAVGGASSENKTSPPALSKGEGVV